jgi:hypothetical protein
MQKIVIRAPPNLAHKLEDILRQKYDVRTEILQEDNGNTIICEIKANILKKWITICRFTSDENLKNIITMFKVNLEIKKQVAGPFFCLVL